MFKLYVVLPSAGEAWTVPVWLILLSLGSGKTDKEMHWCLGIWWFKSNSQVITLMFVCQHLLKTYLLWDYMLVTVGDMKMCQMQTPTLGLQPGGKIRHMHKFLWQSLPPAPGLPVHAQGERKHLQADRPRAIGFQNNVRITSRGHLGDTRKVSPALWSMGKD